MDAGSLKFVAKPVEPGENVYVYKKTYYQPKDFSDSRYDPSFSPLIYPGQTLHASAYIPEYGYASQVSLYVKELRSGKIYESEKQELKKGEWRHWNSYSGEGGCTSGEAGCLLL